jgi:hypothetical protein
MDAGGAEGARLGLIIVLASFVLVLVFVFFHQIDCEDERG